MNALVSIRATASRRRAGYTLAEVLIASALLGMTMGGAISLSATMNVQNESARTTAAALTLQDNAARLWQLGLTSAECNAILPQAQNNERLGRAVISSSGNAVAWGTPSTVTTSMGTVEEIDNTLTIRNPVGGTDRTNLVQAYRPTIR